MTDTKAMPVGVSDERLAEMLADANKLSPNQRSVSMIGNDVVDLRSALSELQSLRARLSTIEAGPGAPSEAQVKALQTQLFRHREVQIDRAGLRSAMIDAKVCALSPIGGEAEPVAWRYCDHDINGDAWGWRYADRKPSSPHSEVEPLFAAPHGGVK